jgi:hypothetical protein
LIVGALLLLFLFVWLVWGCGGGRGGQGADVKALGYTETLLTQLDDK